MNGVNYTLKNLEISSLFLYRLPSFHLNYFLEYIFLCLIDYGTFYSSSVVFVHCSKNKLNLRIKTSLSWVTQMLFYKYLAQEPDIYRSGCSNCDMIGFIMWRFRFLLGQYIWISPSHIQQHQVCSSLNQSGLFCFYSSHYLTQHFKPIFSSKLLFYLKLCCFLGPEVFCIQLLCRIIYIYSKLEIKQNKAKNPALHVLPKY